MNGNIVFLQQHGEFATTTKEFHMGRRYDEDDIIEVLNEVEMEILESPRKAVMHEESYLPVIAYPINALVKRGIKSVINYEHFDNKESYDSFMDAINSRLNDYVVLNKFN